MIGLFRHQAHCQPVKLCLQSKGYTMLMRDRIQLGYWLRGNASLADVENAGAIGLVENVRFTERARSKFRFVWAWSTERFEGRAGAAQERFYKLHGMAALNRRISRVKRATDAWLRAN